MKIVPFFLVLLMQLSFASAFSFTEDLFRPMWDGISGIVGQIVVIIFVVIGFGKAATIEGLSFVSKVIIFIICFAFCLAISFSITTWGVGGEMKNLLGNFKFW